MNRTSIVKILKGITWVGIYGGLLMPLVFAPVVIFPFVFSKMAFFQVVIELTLPAFIVLAWIEPQYRPKRTSLLIAICAYFLAVLVSVIFATDPMRAWWGNQERMNGLFSVLHFLLWFIMATSVVKTWAEWKRLIWFQLCLSVFMGAIALLEKPFPNLLSFPAGDRPGGLLDNPIYMAGYQIFSLFFIALLWLKGVPTWQKIALAMIAIVDIGAFFMAESRGALLGLVCGLLVFALSYVFTSRPKREKYAIVGIFVALLVGYGLLYSARSTAFVQKYSVLSRIVTFNTTIDTRFIAWQIAWQGFLQRPITGWGFDDFHILFNLHYNPMSLRFSYYETWFDRAHNEVLDVLSMTGLLGFITYASIWITIVVATYRAYRKGWIDEPVAAIFVGLMVAYFVQNLSVFDQPAGFMMSFLMFALVNRATQGPFLKHEHVETPEHAKISAGTVWGAFAVIEIIMLLIAWRWTALPVYASILSIDSNNYFNGGDYATAFEYAKEAAATPTPYLDEQTFLQSRNLITLVQNNQLTSVPNWKEWHDLIKQISEEQIAQHPRNTNPLFVYAQFLQTFGAQVPADLTEADQIYKQALATSPERQQLLYAYGRFKLGQGDKQGAYQMFVQALNEDPQVGESWWYAGLTRMFDLGDMPGGAPMVVSSTQVLVPYVPANVNEAAAMAIAMSLTSDKTGLTNLIDNQLPTLTGGTIQFYLDIAQSAEAVGLMDERNKLLGAMVQADPSFALRLGPLESGSATSIQQSLDRTANLVATGTSSTPPVAATNAQTATSTAPATENAGPRR